MMLGGYNMELSLHDIITSADVNELKDIIRVELNRRRRHNFSNFNANLLAE